MSEFKRQLKRAFSGKDNQSTDIGRVIWALGALVFFGLSIYAVAHGAVFDAIAYGTAFGAIMAGGGLGIGMKARAEPESNGPAPRDRDTIDEDKK